ncbi:MAG: bifunctional [glutamate--ammonia ligase]-adenylyl-L-tyrosine phosphorylase/[glutamate--ammonia-ligase] adenylyltransferase [Myxococcota bacterium]
MREGETNAAPFRLDWFELRRMPVEARRSRLRSALDEGPDADRISDALARLCGSSTFASVADWATTHILTAARPAAAAEAVLLLSQHPVHGQSALTHHLLPLLAKTCGASTWAGRILQSQPELFLEVGDQVQLDDWWAPLHRGSSAERLLEEEDDAFEIGLRRFRNREMLRIIYAELLDVDVAQTSGLLSDLAEICIQAAFDHHLRRLSVPGRGVVIGMGKLGGRELNLSSDIDLIYVYESEDPEAHPAFVKLFERVTSSLSRVRAQGLVFRVDLDLRPEGRSGPICNSLSGLEPYYETWGRPWERAAWVRARPVAGDEALGQEVLRSLRPFVWRRNLDIGQVESLVKIKGDIDARRAHKSELDLKLGRGGIREIEFIVQAHQLLQGGRRPELREPNSLRAMEALEDASVLNAKLTDRLSRAYRWLRRLEHRVMLVELAQTHHLPKDPDARRALARSLGLSDFQVVHDLTQPLMEDVADAFGSLLGVAEDREPLPPALLQLLDPALPDDERAEAAHALGVKRPHGAVASLLSCERIRSGPLHPSSPRRDLVARLLWDCLDSADPDRALGRLPDALRALVRHGAYLDRLQDPVVRRGLAHFLGASGVLSEILFRQPHLLTEVLLRRSESVDALAFPIGTGHTEEEMTLLVDRKQAELLRTAVADMAGEWDEVQVEERLSLVAEAVIDAVIQLSRRELEARYGLPEEASLVVVAGGALGAREMSYRTDLDLSALYLGEGQSSGGSRGQITAREWFTRLLQRTIGLLSARSPAGMLYPVDMRLRPSGNQGTLVTSLDGFRRYPRALWERQALLRSRVVWGAPEDREQVEVALDEAAFSGATPDPNQVRRMKERLQRESTASPNDLKLGRGGLLELQFLVQYLQLFEGNGGQRVPSTREALRRLAARGVLVQAEAQALEEAYGRLRRSSQRSRLEDASPPHDDPDIGAARARIHEAFNRWLGGGGQL